MKKLDPASLRHFHSCQETLRSQGVLLEVEEVSGNLVWLRVQPLPEWHHHLGKEKLREVAIEVFRLLPFEVFVSVIDPPLTA